MKNFPLISGGYCSDCKIGGNCMHCWRTKELTKHLKSKPAQSETSKGGPVTPSEEVSKIIVNLLKSLDD